MGFRQYVIFSFYTEVNGLFDNPGTFQIVFDRFSSVLMVSSVPKIRKTSGCVLLALRSSASPLFVLFRTSLANLQATAVMVMIRTQINFFWAWFPKHFYLPPKTRETLKKREIFKISQSPSST